MTHTLLLIIVRIASISSLHSPSRMKIGEAELQGNYIDPIVYPMFHDPQENIYFRWYMNTLHC
jgi:hypothetical protein